MLVRGDSLAATMSRYLIDQIEKTPNIQVWAHAAVIEAHGDTHLEEISVQCSDTDTVERVPATPCSSTSARCPEPTGWKARSRDERGFVLAGPDLLKDGKLPGWNLDRDPFLLESSVPGVFVVGDVRQAPLSASPRRLARARLLCSSFIVTWRRCSRWQMTREELRTVAVFHDLPDEQLDWFLEEATEITSSPATFTSAQETLPTEWWSS